MKTAEHPTTQTQGEPARILVIKHGALGDLILATGPFAAIRGHHPDAHITLLTTDPFAAMAQKSGWFDAVWCDRRPKPWQIGTVCTLRRQLGQGKFERIYDLQTSSRSSSYFRLFSRPRPEWSGVAPGCSHPHANPMRDRMHTIERQADQLAMAGISEVSGPDVSWLDGDVSRFGLSGAFVLMVPGGAAHRPKKRWPSESYGELARLLSDEGVRTVLIGTSVERAALHHICARCEGAVDLCGETDFGDIAALARQALGAVGNDTGPMHLVAAAGCPALVLYSAASDPGLTSPRGGQVTVLRAGDLADLPVAQVRAALTLR